jgi:ADP-ribose pyrophosphatase YjhB (NUDIX family)
MNSDTQIKKRKSLPVGAKCVFKGVIFDVWQWKQKMFDGSLVTFEKLKRADTVNVIALAGQKILLLKQKQPDWRKYKNTLAGGRVDEGESPLQAAKRELLEESGYASNKWILWKKINPYGKIIWTVYSFVARDCVKKQGSKPDAGEKIEARLVNFDEFLKLSEDPDFYEGELKNSLLRARLNKKYRKELYDLLFLN